MEVPATGNYLDRYIAARYIFAILGSTGVGIVNGLMVNLPIAMIGMLNYNMLAVLNTAVGAYDNLVLTDSVSSYYNNIDVIMSNILLPSKDKQCLSIDQSFAKDLRGTFLWSMEQQGIILSSYFWGYLLSQLIVWSQIVEFSPKWTMFCGVLVNIFCTLLTPVLTKTHYFALVVLRLVEGIGGGVILPAFMTMLSKWTPPAERNTMRTVVQGGTLLGIVLSMLISGLLTIKFGWQSVFYVTGGLSIIWCCLWFVLAQDTPQQQPYISGSERNMIVASLKEAENIANQDHQLPWRTVLVSKSFLATLIAHICCNFGWYMLLIELPFYLKLILMLNNAQVTVVMVSAFLMSWLFSLGLGVLLNWMQAKNVINTLAARKIATCIATAGPAICIFILIFNECNRGTSITITIFAVMFTGAMFYGFHSNYDDIAPVFADKLMAFTEIITTVVRLIVPIFAAAMAHGNNKSGLFAIFIVTMTSYIIAAVAYSSFGTIKEQMWAKPRQNSKPVVYSNL